MRKVGFRASFLIVFILLFAVESAMGLSDLTGKVEELGDKLTSSTMGEVIAVEGETLYVNLGEKDSIYEGSEFEVVRLGEVIMAGNKAHHKERPIGEIQITKVREEMSLSRTTTAFAKIEKGDRIYQKRKKVTRIALTEFPYKNGTNDLTRNIYGSLSTCFVRKGLQIVERSQLDRVFQEQKISYSGMIDIGTAQMLGHMLGTEAVLLGSVTDSGNNVVVRARLVDVERGIVMTAAEVEITKNPEIQSMLRADKGFWDKIRQVTHQAQ